MIEDVGFYLASAGLLLSAVAVVVSRSQLRGALSLIVALSCLSALYVMLDASFVAAMQVLVYAGAIMVLFVFVIMLLNLGPDAAHRPAYVSISKVLGSIAVFYCVLRMVMLSTQPAEQWQSVDGTVKHVGALLMTNYLFGFEAISILLLVAVVGAVVLGLKRLT